MSVMKPSVAMTFSLKYCWFLSFNFIIAQDVPFFLYCSSENCTEPNGMPCGRTPQCFPVNNCRPMMMSEALRFTVTHFHNQIRSLTATTPPGASKMRSLQYNNDLEDIAQCWINTCTTEKSMCLVTPQYKIIGQNIGKIDFYHNLDFLEDPAALWQKLMTSWADEINDVNAEIIQKLPPIEERYKYEHYIQIVTDYTAHLGCAWSTNNMTAYFACFYGPSAGIPEYPVYEFGSFCSQCPDGTECYQPLGLCAQTQTEVQHWKAMLRKNELSRASCLQISILLFYFPILVNLFHQLIS